MLASDMRRQVLARRILLLLLLLLLLPEENAGQLSGDGLLQRRTAQPVQLPCTC